MSTMHRVRLTRRTAARLLEQPAAEATDRLGLLIAAAKPEGPGLGELPGEATAVAQFRAAQGARAPLTMEGTSRMARLKRKLLAAPIAALGIAGVAVASGGVALAASQGAVHVPFTGHDNRSSHAPAAPSSTNPGLTHSTAAATDTASPAATPTHPAASPSPSLVGLCHAYLAGATHDGKTNPAFTALTNAAGGADNVNAYCVTLLATAHPTHPAHPVHPTHPAEPTQAASPTHPVHPTHPAKPSQAANQLHPNHPAKPTQAASPTPPAGTSAD